MKRFILLIASIFLSIHIWGQYYSIGDEPFQTKWKQISNARYKIIFPQDAELAALKFANLLCVVDSNSTGDYLFKNRKINVVIHNHSVLSNGFVAIAPKRMEIITHSPASINSQPWLKQLAIHETRHYAQISNLYSGLFKPLYCMFGEQAIGLAAGLIPMWYLEGDAVAYETATSNSGRGRQADFYNYYRAHYLTEDKPFKYDKWLLGSYKDNIPDHYSLGYQLVVYGKLKYGNNIWSQTLKYSTQYPFSLFPFYLGLKSKTGLSRKALHKETFNYLDSLWSINQNKNKTIGIKNYKNPINE